ncbi:hypothetical protein REPUB_Repub03eG0106800 [Reevesia pubescens]
MALDSFAFGFDAGVQAVLNAGAFPDLLRLLANSNEKKVTVGAKPGRNFMVLIVKQQPRDLEAKLEHRL